MLIDANKIINYRLQHNMSQSKFAKLLGITRQKLHLIEKNNTAKEIDVELIEKIIKDSIKYIITGDQIKSYREKNGLTQKALAEKAEISPRYISKLENEKVIFPSYKMKKLLDIIKNDYPIQIYKNLNMNIIIIENENDINVYGDFEKDPEAAAQYKILINESSKLIKDKNFPSGRYTNNNLEALEEYFEKNNKILTADFLNIINYFLPHIREAFNTINKITFQDQKQIFIYYEIEYEIDPEDWVFVKKINKLKINRKIT